ncbi:BTB/POZ and MATH domain-containing protein 2-like protein [Carex littledalei]|uniref:BTB/POZ and MATH domain-containing protein 2-like protein n=1 Tax=Carex littledalei TaxID=544730 RepID=A0A833QJA2_9POAL|nr:BTB/POZ and MATH domain-containing protein 2-like protein [Carex littledalei]
MNESKKKKFKIIDMEASVFEVVLHFIYNDTLPEIDKDADAVMTQHLLVAADRHLASPEALKSAMETDGFEHLLQSCPSVVKDIISTMI